MHSNCVPRTILLIGLLALTQSAASFSPLFSTSAAHAAIDNPKPSVSVGKVAVAGATGRTGKLVVEEALSRNMSVVALVRDLKKAEEVLPDSSSLKVVKCELDDEKKVGEAVTGCDAAIWCATGFSDAPGSSTWQKVKGLLGIAIKPKKTIDAVGVLRLADCFEETDSSVPRVVMLSSAGVTRPQWDEEKKERFPGSADIPIVRLNPFGILDVKAESEEALRQCGVPYTIVRPCGLNDKWPAGSRPIFTQGDVAAGRTNRQDLAKVLVDVLTSPEATGKTFEMFTVAGYQPPVSIAGALSSLQLDREGPPSPEAITATYAAMQQLLPGERQDSAALAMGQTYDQLDSDEEGRFGKRGEEDLTSALPTVAS